ncbi:MAG: DNA-3-methyladenine glycosylase [Gracilimonas sp.]|uniref:DNA-3-methyladenine glycosylase n=1 Tax=Gracilimonas TaxID=649462 RepID=UPI001B2E90CC|nr:DNA-3-methyladenine glycosylase [Gracilimonas sp.]MBO6585656.1 DNA-3-methyladenine glycosylase [Gracilimonas sp.]MBO6616653.1 DNA-3-methyladenine glycosylase [Gracilimonas sp.]
MPSKLSRSFYERDEVVQISKELIGKVICTNFDGVQTAGIIVETEAYNGRTDRACHAYPDVRTARTETIYGPPGYAYVYLCYGIHHLFNVVTNREGLADAILIRAIQPIEGEDIMVQRRGRDKLQPVITNGPGKLSQAMGITTSNNQSDLLGDIIWIEDRGIKFAEKEIEASPRIGVDYAGEDAELPWRFTVKGSKWISK